LKSLGELGYEHYKVHLVMFFLEEMFVNKTLPKLARSCKDFWIPVLKVKEERELCQKKYEDFCVSHRIKTDEDRLDEEYHSVTLVRHDDDEEDNIDDEEEEEIDEDIGLNLDGDEEEEEVKETGTKGSVAEVEGVEEENIEENIECEGEGVKGEGFGFAGAGEEEEKEITKNKKQRS
jgi:hypothetical protein